MLIKIKKSLINNQDTKLKCYISFSLILKKLSDRNPKIRASKSMLVYT